MPIMEAKSEWLRAGTSARPVGVDKENRRLLGAIVAQEGNFKTPGRGAFDGTGLRLIAKLMRAEPKGLKSRLSHATLSDDGVSRYLGRWSNPWIDKIEVNGQELEAVRADFQLSDTAFDSNPNGDLGSYVLSLAEEDPEAIGASLVLQVEQKYRLDNRGHRLKDDKGEDMPPLWFPTQLHSVDVVAVGDSTNALLSAGVDPTGLPDSIVRQGCELLDAQFAGQPRNVVEARLGAFVGRYLSYRFGESLEPQDEPADRDEGNPPDSDADEAALLDLLVE